MKIRDTILKVSGLTVTYGSRGGPFSARTPLRAVRGIDFDLERGEVLGLVGESGCGKSSVGKALVGLVPADGGIAFAGERGAQPLAGAALHRKVQMIFQDPTGSLNPRMRVREIVGEGLAIHRIGDATDRRRRIIDALEAVGLGENDLDRFPHQFSGGQKQRISIARALVMEPDVLIADEAVSALDVSVQAQILNLLRELKQQRDISIIFISHNLGVVRYICDRILIMYLGEIVEEGESETIFNNPQHPYTQLLLRSIPRFGEQRGERGRFETADLPNPRTPPAGCAFHPRCPERMPNCDTTLPPKVPVGPEHAARCLLHQARQPSSPRGDQAKPAILKGALP